MKQANIGLLVRLKAKPGKETELSDFLKSSVALAEKETGTTSWFALKLGDTEYGIFDTFADEAGRDAHRTGEIATQLRQRAGDLLSAPPAIEATEILGCKF